MRKPARIVATVAVVAAATAYAATAHGDAPVVSTGGGTLCSPQLVGADAVTFGLTPLSNRMSAIATVTEVSLVDPTPGISIAGVRLADVDDPGVVNGAAFAPRRAANLAVGPGQTALVVVGVTLADGVPTARAEGLRIRYESSTGSGTVTSGIAVRTIAAGRECEPRTSSTG